MPAPILTSPSRWLLTMLSLAVFACNTPPPATDQANTSDYYQEKHRPQYHFTPEAHWMNDPNGMFYLDGEYHLFYQYYPDSTVWGPMHWGHAISKDLTHWEHLPIALYPDSLGMIFSGSAVVDTKNTSGFGKAGQTPIVAIFTQHDMAGEKAGKSDFQTQSIAYSLDKGRTWTVYDQNPVLPNPGIRDFRDPKVMWHEASARWVMALACQDHIRFYTSPDLKKWELGSEFGKQSGAHGGVWECPDLFPLTVDGETHWVLFVSINPGGVNGGSGTQYFVGDFDGKKFTNTNTPDTQLWLDYGRDNYAGVTWSNIPASDGRRLFIGWMSNWNYAQVVPTTVWRSAMTLPRTLSLVQAPEGLRVASQPVQELSVLRKDSVAINLEGGKAPKALPITGSLLELVLDFDWEGSLKGDLVLKFENSQGEYVQVMYNDSLVTLSIDRTAAGDMSFEPGFKGVHPAPLIGKTEGSLSLHVFLDKSSLEVFSQEGKTVLTDIFFPGEDFTTVKCSTTSGQTVTVKGMGYGLKSAW